MIDGEVVWLVEPVEDILDFVTLKDYCGKFCGTKTATQCTTDCEGFCSTR
jgi:hypothetical protein